MALLPCGHHPACMYRYREYPSGRTRRFCMACVVEQFPTADLDIMLTKHVPEPEIEPEYTPEETLSLIREPDQEKGEIKEE